MKTTAMVEIQFKREDYTFSIIDISGVQSERRKWVHFMENITAVIFVAALSDYCLNLFEDNETSRLEESLRLFSELSNSKWFLLTEFILFLNKKDIFEEKIQRIPLTVCFPGYSNRTLYTIIWCIQFSLCGRHRAGSSICSKGIYS